MNNKIRVLDEKLVNKIAAGEIVERPASVVKELIENSIDAGSSRISIEIVDGGKKYIKVVDDGIGMNFIDAQLAFERHATSKIFNFEDLYKVKTLGFRGEALPSIAAVSMVCLKTKTDEEELGTCLNIKAGKIVETSKIGWPGGTSIEVSNIFFNTPARLKHLKSAATEFSYISDLVSKFTLGNPEKYFKLTHNGKVIIDSPGNEKLIDTIINVYGLDAAKSMVYIEEETSDFRLYGYISKPELFRGNRTHQSFFVNGRMIKDYLLSKAVEEGYKTLLPRNSYPVFVLNLNIDLDRVDVNVHPSKIKVRFDDEKGVYVFIKEAVQKHILSKRLIPGFEFPEPKPKQDLPRTEDNIKQQQIYLTELNSNQSGNLTTETKKNEYLHKKREKILNEEKVSCKYKPQDKLPEMVPLSQLFNTYILAQSKDEFFIIDQHAAHERIIYESLLENYEKRKAIKQTILTPFSVNLTYFEKNIVIQNLEIFERLGYEIEDFGEKTILIRSVPSFFNKKFVDKHFLSIVDGIVSFPIKNSKIENKIITVTACRAAIKASDRLNLIEIKKLLDQLKQTRNPYTCPHGRPTIVSISQNELMKKFKRI